MISFESDNYKIIAHGSADRRPNKVHHNITLSTNGVEEESYVRAKMDYEINIVKISQDEYDTLIDIYMYENDFTMVDTERNYEGNSYKINGAEFSLTPVENKKKKGYYYTGNFKISKI